MARRSTSASNAELAPEVVGELLTLLGMQYAGTHGSWRQFVAPTHPQSRARNGYTAYGRFDAVRVDVSDALCATVYLRVQGSAPQWGYVVSNTRTEEGVSRLIEYLTSNCFNARR